MPAISAGILLYRRVTGGAPAGAATAGGAPAGGARSVKAADRIEVLLVHPGGPYWAKKDAGAWSIPKGEAEPDEMGEARPAPERDAAWRRPAPAKPRLRAVQADLLAVARREFREETGLDPDAQAAPGAAYAALGGVKQRGHKIVYVWALEGDCDPSTIRSDDFEIEWPPRSGRAARFPEVDRAAWFDLATAREKIVAGQRRFLDDVALLGARTSTTTRSLSS